VVLQTANKTKRNVKMASKKNEINDLKMSIDNLLNEMYGQGNAQEEADLATAKETAKEVYKSDLKKADKAALLKNIVQGLGKIGAGLYGNAKNLAINVDMPAPDDRKDKISALERYNVELQEIRDKQKQRRAESAKQAMGKEAQMSNLQQQLKEAKEERIRQKQAEERNKQQDIRYQKEAELLDKRTKAEKEIMESEWDKKKNYNRDC
jgi:hypothetical protein